jgi:hydrogenase/urease accessory protein HupE
LALALVACLAPGSAAAHSPVPGLAGFYTGMLHPLSTPGQLLGLLALGLMLGLRWPQWCALAWLSFAVSALLGICLGQVGFVPTWGEAALLILAVSAAALAALHPPGFLTLFLLFSGLCGLLIGALSTPDPGPVRDTIITLAGSFVGANIALIYVTGGIGWLRERFTQHWAHVGLRVVAAWIAAISVLSALIALDAQ